MHACTYQYVWTVGKGLVLPLAKLNLCQSSNKMLKKMHACTEKYKYILNSWQSFSFAIAKLKLCQLFEYAKKNMFIY